MENVVTIYHDQEIVENSQFSNVQLEILKNSIAPNLDHNQFKFFVYICTKHNLDPMAKQIYPILKADKKTGKMQLIPIISIDGLRLIADRTNKYAPGRPSEFSYDDKGNLLSATAYVKKLVGGEWHEVSATALFSEYSTGQNTWATKKHIMLEKCAEAKAIRRAFPADTSGLYSEEEKDCINDETLSSKKPVEEPCISQDQIKLMEDYFIGKEDLKKQLLTYCKVKSLNEIKESQLIPCRNFIKAKSKQYEEVEHDENS